MDHHCIWIMNCVGFNNLGHFTRLMTFAALACILSLILIGICTFLVIGRLDGKNEMVNSATVFIAINGTILIPMTCIISMLAYNNIYNVIRNITCIESIQMEDEAQMLSGSELGAKNISNPYDLGWRRNVDSVLGDIWWLWWMPQLAKIESGLDIEKTD